MAYSLVVHRGEVSQLELISSDLIASCSEYKKILVWNFKTKTCLRVIDKLDFVVSKMVLVDGTLACACDDAKISIYDLNNWKLVSTLNGHSANVLALEKLDENVLASGSSDNTIKIWDLKTEACINTLVAHESSVLSIAKVELD